MIDYSYVECSTACITAIVEFCDHFPDYRRTEVDAALSRGRSFLKSIQRSDGSWYGSWGCCFTYATWFGIEGLVAAGESVHSPHVTKAVQYLLSHQRANGGWGEDFTSCYDKAYAAKGAERYGKGGSGVVNTAWALLALMAAGTKDTAAVRRGIEYLMAEQRENGDWKQEGITGVFNRACGISYTQYTWEAQLVDFAAEVLPDGLGWPRMASLTACRCSRARPSCSRAIASDCMLIATLIRCSRARPSCSQAIASAVASWRARPRRSARRCAAWCCATRRGSSSNDV